MGVLMGTQMNERAPAAGFTLIELMIVVAIIGLLAALAIPNFLKFQARSKQAEARSNLKACYTDEKSYYGNQGMYYDELSIIGFEPQANNRYQYDLGGGGTETRGCGAIPVYANLASNICPTGPAGVGRITVDEKWNTCVDPAYPVVAVSGGIPGGDLVPEPAVPSAVPVATCCPGGQCEFVCGAEGNVDNDPTVDTWFIGSFQSTAVGAASTCGPGNTGLYAEGDPVNVCNDVSY
jgi:type IV pilus assembly protein PilA